MSEQSVIQSEEWTIQRVIWTTLIVIFAALAFWLVYRFNQVVFILFIAIVIGTVIRPVVTWLHRQGLPRMAGVILVYFLLLILLISFLLLLFPMIIQQGTTIAAAMPSYYQTLRLWLLNNPNEIIVSLGRFTPVALPSLSLQPAQPSGAEVIATAGQLLGYAAWLARLGFIGVVMLVLAYYWTLDGPRTIKSLLLLFPLERRDNLAELIAAMEKKVGLYIIGEGILCLMIAIMALVAYLLIGLPNALVLALVAGVMEVVPMVGPLLGAIPALLVAISLGPDKLIWVILATVVIQQIENSLLVPRIMSKAVGVNPFVALLSFFAFSSMLGVGGALMAIPLAAILQLVLDRYVFNPGLTEAEGAIGRDYASRLRYEAQDLAQDLRKQARLTKGGSDLKVRQIDQVLDEIETIATDLDGLLAQVPPPGAP